MCGKLTLTTEVSNTSITALAMTAVAISQRPACGRFPPPVLISLVASPGSRGARFASASNGLDDHIRDHVFAQFRTHQHVV